MDVCKWFKGVYHSTNSKTVLVHLIYTVSNVAANRFKYICVRMEGIYIYNQVNNYNLVNVWALGS